MDCHPNDLAASDAVKEEDEFLPLEHSSEVRDLASAWQQELPSFARRPALSELLQLTTESDQATWLQAAACTAFGPRPSNEDRHVLECNWTTLPEASCQPGASAALFVVCDGHGGSSVSSSVSRNLGILLRTELDATQWSDADSRKVAVRNAFLKIDGLLRQADNPSYNRCGSTCVAAVVWRSAEAGSFQVLLANLGDSQGLLYRAGSDTLIETKAHKPDHPHEKKRIRAAGGYVLAADPPQPARVDGVLAMARAFGDFDFKGVDGKPLEEQKVSPMPDVYEYQAAAGDTLVLACDGLFDVCTAVEVGALAACSLSGSQKPVEAAASLVWAALQRDTQDNVSCVVVKLGESG